MTDADPPPSDPQDQRYVDKARYFIALAESARTDGVRQVLQSIARDCMLRADPSKSPTAAQVAERRK